MFDVKVKDVTSLERRNHLKHILCHNPEEEQGLIVFYGDSGFTRWRRGGINYDHRPLEEDIRAKDGSLACLNHGFGTSTAEEQLYFYDRLIRPWAPRALVCKTFGNDYGAGYTPQEIISLQARYMDYARHEFPGIRLYLCDVCPGVKERSSNREYATKEFNEMVRAYCATHDDTTLVDHSTCTDLFEPGYAGDYDHARKELYVKDGVHFNQDGYDVYRDFFKRVLDDIL